MQVGLQNPLIRYRLAISIVFAAAVFIICALFEWGAFSKQR